MKRIILIGYKENVIERVYDMPYVKTKRGYFLLIINEKIDELLLFSDIVTLRVEEDELWIVDYELWMVMVMVMNYEWWTMNAGLWMVDYELWTMDGRW